VKIYKLNNDYYSTRKSFKNALLSVLNDKSILVTRYNFGLITSLMLTPKKVIYELNRATTKKGDLELNGEILKLEIIETKD